MSSRSFTAHAAAQGTPEWLAARLGRVTASRCKDVLATIKTGEAAARRDYRVQLVCERLTGQPQDDVFVSSDMQRGTDLEPVARAAYEAQTGQWVEQVGFLAHTSMMAGGSPDGVVGDYHGLIEIKCPRPARHIQWMRAGGVPADHLAQVRMLLWLTGAEWCDFISYCPQMPENLRVYVAREEVSLAVPQMAHDIEKFLVEVDNEESALRGWGVIKETA